MSYRVTAPLVLARDKESKVHERYEGAVIDWLDDDQKRHFLEAKLVEELSAPAPVEAAVDDEPDDGKPKKTAPKADWVEYAVVNDYDRDDIEAMSKADIQALFD